MPLTHLALDAARPREKPYKLSDGDGLHLLVTDKGAKLWRFRYRFGGKQLMLSFGSYPEVSLATARQKRHDARAILAEGKNPSQERRDEKLREAVASANTFGAIAKELIDKLEDEGKAAATLKKQRWFLEDLAADLTTRPIAQITAAEILAILRKVEKSGFKETARRLRGAIGRVFRYAIATLRAETDPTYALRGALAQPKVKHRPAIVDEERLGQLLRDVDAYEGRSVVGKALTFLSLTLCRPVEVRLMHKREVNWLKATWTIPAERMKMRREFQIPLSKQALAVLQEVWEGSKDIVFPAPNSLMKYMSDNTYNKALRVMGYDGDTHVAHGFRSTASTIMNERRMAHPDVIEVALAHQDENEVRRAYNRAQYFEERQKLLQEWADLLDQLKAQPPKQRRA